MPSIVSSEFPFRSLTNQRSFKCERLSMGFLILTIQVSLNQNIMYGIKIKERIQRIQRVGTSNRTHKLNPIKQPDERPFNTVSPQSDPHLSREEQALQLGKYIPEMEERDHLVILEAPVLPDMIKERQKILKLWLGDVCRQVFSVSFNYFLNKIFDTQTTKAFCSECFIGNFVNLSKKNRLTGPDYELINRHLQNELLPYFLLRYPQSNNKQVNQNLNKQISQTNSLSNNQNNLFLLSGIPFEYRESQSYLDLIMKFLNYLLLIPERQIDEQTTFFDHFNNKMENLFQSVNSRLWTETNYYDEYMNSDEDVATLRAKMEKLEKVCKEEKNLSANLKDIVGNLSEGSAMNLGKDQQNDIFSQKTYEDSVKSYTSYAINQKISKNVPKFSEQDDIRHSCIKIKSSSVLRIIVKWCLELSDKFKNPDYFFERDEPFVMMNGGVVEMNNQLRKKLCIMAQEEWKDIQHFLKTIQLDNYDKQGSLSFSNLMYYSDQTLPEFEESMIKFSNRNTSSTQHYAVVYLNRLIHGFLTLSKKIYDQDLKYWAQWPSPPQFLSFSIGDLMRCKCFSREKEIIRIYKQIQLRSIAYPEDMKIVQVKNRLNRGTKDILINVLMKGEALCQIQLAIKNNMSPFILHSDKFNHYVYELKRSIFGPVSEMCSIWTSTDERASLFTDFRIRQNQIQHKCKQINYVPCLLPFTCNRCFKYYSNVRYIIDHMVCDKCQGFQVCAICRLNQLSEGQIKDTLGLDHQQTGSRILPHEEFPEYFYSFQLQSQKKDGRKYRKFQFENRLFFVRRSDGSRQSLRIKNYRVGSQKEKAFFFQKYIFFKLNQPDQELAGIHEQEVMDDFSIKQISSCYRKKDQGLRITKKNITKQLILGIMNPRGQSTITTFSFPQNKINELKEISKKFPNVKVLNLGNNGLKSLEGIGNMKKLTDVYVQENDFTQIVELDHLKDLKYIQLGNNIHAPQIKCDLSGLPKLQSVTFISSNLEKFPEKFCDISNLKLLWLFDNYITEIPPSIGKLKALKNFNLYSNNLSSLPDELYTLTDLEDLKFGWNDITQISSKIKELKKIKELSIFANPIQRLGQGDGDEFMEQFPKLQKIYISEDQVQRLGFSRHNPKIVNLS